MLWMGNIQAHWTNAFVRSLFLVGGPEGVGGVEVSIRRNAFRVSPDTPSVGFALVTFATREAASEALARLHDTLLWSKSGLPFTFTSFHPRGFSVHGRFPAGGHCVPTSRGRRTVSTCPMKFRRTPVAAVAC